jgi:hypothetical protein
MALNERLSFIGQLYPADLIVRLITESLLRRMRYANQACRSPADLIPNLLPYFMLVVCTNRFNE